MIKVGSPRFDALAVGEVTINLLGPTINMTAKAAFIDSVTGSTCGWTNNTQWSHETIAKMKELTLLLERDIAHNHFSGSSEVAASPVPHAPNVASTGLGEHLGDEPPQV
jgi:hypothetical protein